VATQTETLLVLAIGGAVAWALWCNTRPRPLFTVRLAAGQPAAVDGTVTPAFLARLRELAAAHRLVDAEVTGYAHESVIRLHFSHHVPEAARQQLRNWWAMHGWSAPRRTASSRCG
jgi:hypothetical protein